MKKDHIKALGIMSASVAGAAFVTSALYCGLTVKRYAFPTGKLEKPVRLVHISDLHGCRYGENQSRLLAEIRRQRPDAIVMTGDIADDCYPLNGTLEFLEGIEGKYPCYYVSGNHECQGGKLDHRKKIFKSYGVRILAGESAEFRVSNQKILICGVDDPEVGESRFRRQLGAALGPRPDGIYTVLLSHRPERVKQYAKYSPDLVLTGHAHGGQWRLPFLINGLIAPNQGLFPKYAGGHYYCDGFEMVVNRGLARESTPLIPRVFNPPELVVIDIIPQNPDI